MNQETKKHRRRILEHWQIIALYLVVYDALAVTGSYFLALWLRFDGRFSGIPREFLMAWARFAPIYALFCVVVFWLLNLYRSLWRFASFNELSRVIASSAISAIFHTVCITVFFMRMPLSYYIIGAGFQFVLVLAIRFSYRFVLLL